MLDIQGYEAFHAGAVYVGKQGKVDSGRPVVPYLGLGYCRLPSIDEVLDEISAAARKFDAKSASPPSRAGFESLEQVFFTLPEEYVKSIARKDEGYIKTFKNNFHLAGHSQKQMFAAIPAIHIGYAFIPEKTHKRITKSHASLEGTRIYEAMFNPSLLEQGLGLRWYANLELGKNRALPKDYNVLSVARNTPNRNRFPLLEGYEKEMKEVIDGIYESIHTPESIRSMRDISESDRTRSCMEMVLFFAQHLRGLKLEVVYKIPQEPENLLEDN